MKYKVLIEMGFRGVARHFLRSSPEGIRINNNNNDNNKSTVIKIMMKIFNLLMESGILPTDLKVANFEHEFSVYSVREVCRQAAY